jgi:hypothetical protein
MDGKIMILQITLKIFMEILSLCPNLRLFCFPPLRLYYFALAKIAVVWTNPDLYDILATLPPSGGRYYAPNGVDHITHAF